MKRRDFLRNASVASLSLSAGLDLLAAPAGATRTGPAAPPEIGPGPHLFLDDHLLDRMEGLTRQVQQPRRLDGPVLDSRRFGTSQPYLTVLREGQEGRFRIWYNHGQSIWHAESEDGIAWRDPRLVWDLPHVYGASLIDDADREPDPSRRYKLANWQGTRDDTEGLYVGFSPDGLQWTGFPGNPVLPTWPEGVGTFTRQGVGDTVDVYYDPLSQLYAAAVKVHALPEDNYAPAPKAGKVFRRLVGMTASRDFLRWEEPWRIFAPDEQDEGLLEFYGMGGMHVRGGLRIGLLRVLRDDLSADPDGPKDGIGYSVLATSRDGKTWHRDRAPFLDRNPEPGSWDHAMAWLSDVVPVGDELFFYYGGYARGHKIAADRERQIGLARLRKDRYVAVEPTGEDGILRTRPFVVPGDRLTVNARAAGGELRVRLLGPLGMPRADLGPADSAPITGDQLAAEVRWQQPLGALRGQVVCLEFRLRRAALFGFEFHGDRES